MNICEIKNAIKNGKFDDSFAMLYGDTEAAKARYIKAEIEGTIECPYWHYGIGFPSWFFIDEVSVY